MYFKMLNNLSILKIFYHYYTNTLEKKTHPIIAHNIVNDNIERNNRNNKFYFDLHVVDTKIKRHEAKWSSEFFKNNR